MTECLETHIRTLEILNRTRTSAISVRWSFLPEVSIWTRTWEELSSFDLKLKNPDYSLMIQALEGFCNERSIRPKSWCHWWFSSKLSNAITSIQRIMGPIMLWSCSGLPYLTDFKWLVLRSKLWATFESFQIKHLFSNFLRKQSLSLILDRIFNYSL